MGGHGDVRRWGCEDVGMWDVTLLSVPIAGQTLVHSPQHCFRVLRGALLLSLPPHELPVPVTLLPIPS